MGLPQNKPDQLFLFIEGKIPGLGRAVSLEVVLPPRGAFRKEIELKKSFANVALMAPCQTDNFFNLFFIYFFQFLSILLYLHCGVPKINSFTALYRV